jgi:hypothetical protein
VYSSFSKLYIFSRPPQDANFGQVLGQSDNTSTLSIWSDPPRTAFIEAGEMFSLILLFAIASLHSFLVYGFPNVPFYTDGRWIRDSTGATFTYTGVNWVGHLDAMVVEGLQYQNLTTIVSRINSSGFNSIRLTWAVQMVDEIYENNGQDTSIKDSFVTALGEANGTTIFNAVVANNPSFNENTTRLQVRSICRILDAPQVH